MKLDRASCALIVVDVQPKLMAIMHRAEELRLNLIQLINGIQILHIPIIVTEQYPRGLGQTHTDIRQVLQHYQPIEKLAFSACGEPAFMQALEELGRRQLLVAGIEAHICVYQTCRDLVVRGFDVQVVTDALASRTPENRELAIRKMEHLGVRMTGIELLLFELLETAEAGEFKTISKIIK